MILEGDVVLLLDLVRSGKQSESVLLINKMLSVDETSLIESLDSLITDMKDHDVFNSANIEAKVELANVVVFKCKNALEQLTYLKVKGSEAAEKTLNLAEKAQKSLDDLSVSPDDAIKVDLIKADILDLILSQTHHDLSDQVLTKLVDFVEHFEILLAQIIDLNLAQSVSSGLGPSVTTSEKELACDGQDDIDELFASNVGG
ncbi:protein phosphatase CheZ [Pseudoalteromonas marina]|uniref:Protein phosphatase CheZ n=1 Tax=Pseudoalteromonas marina TaxID=267375 RepID=A0ABT9FCF8_9GAMM|nr:protein phosphatase CheZ [Pseudoalteromonas marina]MDP2564320.1 protein phosphatase CheZ [Pseudoalteromonas marina]